MADRKSPAPATPRSRAPWGWLLAGVMLGGVGVVGFNFSLEATSSDEFCLSCHNHAIPLEQHKLTSHYRNRHGIAAGCSDCHVQHEFLPKMKRKIEAAREVWGHMRGVIDTEEKYRAHQPEMRERELARFRASNSATCRSCHSIERMDLAAQSAKGRRSHEKFGSDTKTCVDCHEDAGHALEETVTEGESFDF